MGLSVAKAAEKIGALSLKVNPQNQVDSTQPAGTVLRQDPAANTQVNAGTTVTIYIATAANTVTVPILTNMSQDTAVANLTCAQAGRTDPADQFRPARRHRGRPKPEGWAGCPGGFQRDALREQQPRPAAGLRA